MTGHTQTCHRDLQQGCRGRGAVRHEGWQRRRAVREADHGPHVPARRREGDEIPGEEIPVAEEPRLSERSPRAREL